MDPQKFAAFNVLEDDELRQGMFIFLTVTLSTLLAGGYGNMLIQRRLICIGIKEYSSWPTIPQLYVNKEFVGGCDILMSMHSSGELADLFEKADVLAKEEPEVPAAPVADK